MLEVSSPGIERRIREDEHLEQNIGNKIEVHTFKAIDKQKSLIGILKEYNESSIKIENQNQIIEIEKSNITKMKTVYNWEEQN